jgi:hypothetical protein
MQGLQVALFGLRLVSNVLSYLLVNIHYHSNGRLVKACLFLILSPCGKNCRWPVRPNIRGGGQGDWASNSLIQAATLVAANTQILSFPV